MVKQLLQQKEHEDEVEDNGNAHVDGNVSTFTLYTHARIILKLMALSLTIGHNYHSAFSKYYLSCVLP